MACNPRAGHYRASEVERLRHDLAARGHTVSVVDSLAYAADPSRWPADCVAIVGGDGTARIVVGAAHDAGLDPAFWVVPAGTVNLIARETGSDRAGADTVARILSEAGDRAAHYRARIGDTTFLCCASVGPDSMIVDRVTPALKKRWGRMAYVLACLAQLRRWPRTDLQVTADGRRHAAEAVFVLKGRFYAGPWTLDGSAALTTPHLHLVLLPRARRRDIARLAASALLGGRFADPAWVRLRASDVAVETATSLAVQADGDVVARTPVRFSIVTDPVRFIAADARHRDRGAA